MTAPLPVAVFALALVAAVPASRAALEDDGRQMIEKMSKSVSVIVKGATSKSDRETRFRNLFQKNFDVRTIGRWVMGRLWRSATAAQQTAYLEVFETYIVKTYTVQLAGYGGERLRVVGVEKDGRGVAVISHIQPKNKRNRPIVIRWRLRKKRDRLLIRDVVIDGISMSLNQRREFAAVYAREGTVDGLIATIRKKITKLDAK